jgi:hypothetical protein
VVSGDLAIADGLELRAAGRPWAQLASSHASGATA